ncbi:unnamed protein product [Trifolium pratense]|uniref:Uncharacterized protein n=1 Tax=Trifolium pratense TaxID=57577 RepID=A0ACB0L9A3_TRIPR|nr:unnamed protein product [Trifolium pratense]
MASTNEKVISSYIPDEISYSILSKLPLKSLKRFKCVQKSWSLLCENHHFMNMFLNRFLSYNDPTSLILLRVLENINVTCEEIFYSFSGERFENKVKLDWSSSLENHFEITGLFGQHLNGTLCLYGDYGEIVLLNPTTQTMKPLPASEAQSVELSIPDEAFGYVDLQVEYCLVHGFGYEPVINDYKVIRILIYNLQSSAQSDADWLSDTNFNPVWEIYSLRSNSWRKLHVNMPYTWECTDGAQVYMDGVCHWFCRSYRNVGPCLVSFYLRNEEFLVTLIPSDIDNCFDFDVQPSWINLAVLNEYIALISYHKETTTFHISILSEFGMKESWTKLLIVGPLSCVQRPIKVGTKGEIFFIRKDAELVWLDLSTQMIAEVGYKEREALITEIIVYKESILPN